MDFSNLFFGKTLTDLTYEDIEQFFVNPQDESDKLECKSYTIHPSSHRPHSERENDILENICAFLNSEGGLLIWGAPSEVRNSGRRTFQGVLTPFTEYIDKDSFIRKIANKISPSPYGVNFQRVEKHGKYIYIIEAQKSNYSPHQFQNIYYMRLDGQTHKAPHYFVEALFRKITYPKLDGKVMINKINAYKGHNSNSKYMDLLFLEFKHTIQNQSILQNEFDLFYKIIFSHSFEKTSGTEYKSDRKYNHEKGEITGTIVKSVLHHGEPFHCTEQITFDYRNLESKNYQLGIKYIFGGKQSPLLQSNYILNVGNYSHDLSSNNLNNNYISIKENRPIFEEDL